MRKGLLRSISQFVLLTMVTIATAIEESVKALIIL